MSGFSVQVSALVFLLLTPETRNLKPKIVEFDACNLGFRYSSTPKLLAVFTGRVIYL